MNTVDTIRQMLEQIEKLDQITHKGPSSFYLGKLELYIDTLFGRFCPFKMGQRVRLTQDFKTTERGHGWFGSQQFLVTGAIGTVCGVDVRMDGKFEADIEFDNQTWVDRDGNKQPVIRPHTYLFSEDWLEVIQ